MFWKILDRSTSILFLLIAIIVAGRLVTEGKTPTAASAEKKTIMDDVDNRTYYLEGKINRLGESTDSYQLNISKRLDIIERKIEALESKRRDTTRIINNNTNNNLAKVVIGK